MSALENALYMTNDVKNMYVATNGLKCATICVQSWKTTTDLKVKCYSELFSIYLTCYKKVNLVLLTNLSVVPQYA